MCLYRTLEVYPWMSLKVKCCGSTILRTKKISSFLVLSVSMTFCSILQSKSHELPLFVFQDMTPDYSSFISILEEPNTSHSFSASVNTALCFLRLCGAFQVSLTPPPFPIVPTYRTNSSDNYRPSLNSRAKQPLSSVLSTMQW